jgi:hypothetical protein
MEDKFTKKLAQMKAKTKTKPGMAKRLSGSTG